DFWLQPQAPTSLMLALVTPLKQGHDPLWGPDSQFENHCSMLMGGSFPVGVLNPLPQEVAAMSVGEKNKNHMQFGFRSLMSKGNLVQAKVTSTLAPSYSTSSWASRTRHEKKTVALSRKIATKKLAKAAKIPRKATMAMSRNNHQNVVTAVGTKKAEKSPQKEPTSNHPKPGLRRWH
uniref:Uncharacterized protein n=1 Tax=Terrapene triunguis TaxID=2587831 RepID=A0A674K880_9SAUR